MIIDLTQPVDVHYEWIDACEQVAKDQAQPTTYAIPASQPALAQAHRRAGAVQADKYDREDGFIDDDGVDAEADYDDED